MAKRILICYPESESGNAILEAGRRMARALKAELTIIKVQPEAAGLTGYYEHLFHEEMARIDSIFGRADIKDILFAKKVFEKDRRLPNFKIAAGDPAQAIVNELKGGDYQMVVLGVRRNKPLGRVAEAVVKNSPTDVLLIKI